MGGLKKRNTLIGGVIGLLAIAAVAVGGSGATTALWSNSASLDGATINSGNLAVQAINDLNWRDISTNPFVPIPDISTYKTVPGDVLDSRQSVAVALKGDNMTATVQVNLATPTGALAATSKGVTVKYTIYSNVGTLIQGDIPAGTTSTPISITPSTAGVVSALPSASGTFIIKTIVTFDATTTDRVRTEAMAVVQGATITITQVRP